jgi:MoaA/NifB/PqqE/SkfB family radical SAM enzyme
MTKRFEIYIGFKCNNDCVFCIEKKNREKFKQKKVLQTEKAIRELFNKYKSANYNHVNLLGGEPFLEDNFLKILKIAKEYGFLAAVTTNGSVLANEKIAQTHLSLIDDLIISIHGHNQSLVNKQCNNKFLFSQQARAFKNVKKNFKGRILKANIVINNINYQYLTNIVQYIIENGIKEISLTSMSIEDYNKDYAVKFTQLKPYLNKISEIGVVDDIKLRFSDIPLCVLGNNYFLANNLYFDQRDKFDINGQAVVFDREKYKNNKCQKCLYNDLCPGIDLDYVKLFGDKELKSFI